MMNLTVNFGGNGNGSVNGTPGGIHCDNHNDACKHTYDTATWVTLTATPAEGSEFVGWGGHKDCAKRLYMISNIFCTAYFEQLPATLSITTVGKGKVSSDPEGIDCNQCTHAFEAGEAVVLTAIPAEGWQLEQWTGDCDEQGHVMMNDHKNCQVTFIYNPQFVNGQQLFDGIPISQHEMIRVPEDAYLTSEKKRVIFNRLKKYLFVKYKLHAVPLSAFKKFVLPGYLNPFGKGTIYKFAQLKTLEQAAEHFIQSGEVEYVSYLLNTEKSEQLFVILNQIIVKRSSKTDETAFIEEINTLFNEKVDDSETLNIDINRLRLSYNKYLIKITSKEKGIGTNKISDITFAFANLLSANWAEPNFLNGSVSSHFIPNDPLFGPPANSDALQSTGQWQYLSEIKLPEAWDIAKGNDIIIAINDTGVDIEHEDLESAIWHNMVDPINFFDDDGNGYIDDEHGWNFTDDNNSPETTDYIYYSGKRVTERLPPNYHGTAVAGIAAARSDNDKGIAGVAMEATILPITQSSATDCKLAVESILYEAKYAHIANHSWGGLENCSMSINDAISDAITGNNIEGGTLRGDLGTVLFFASGNIKKDIDHKVEYPASNPSVIAIGASDGDKRADFSKYGAALDIIAPGESIITTKGKDASGVENYCNPDGHYCFGFSGTSAATPIAAGVAALILSVQPHLTYLQVQRLLQDTADKIEPLEAKYDANTGFSTPDEKVEESTHGWGRINALEAVRIVAPADSGGKEGVDIFLRDNALDWGNTPGFQPWWESRDIKIDAPPYQSKPTTGSEFDQLKDENPSLAPGDINKVYVRVHNRGPVEVGSETDPVLVKVHWAQFGTALPELPSDFWDVFPEHSTELHSKWHPLNCATGIYPPACSITHLRYSGSSVAGTIDDAAQIVTFDFPAPSYDESLENHFCLVAMVDSSQDRLSPLKSDVSGSFDVHVVDQLTPRDNNVTHRNYHGLDTSQITRFERSFKVRNPFKQSIQSLLTLETPMGWPITLNKPFSFNKLFTLKPYEEIPVTVTASLPKPALAGKVTIIQNRLVQSLQRTRRSAEMLDFEVMGGITLQLQPMFDDASVEQHTLNDSEEYLTATIREGDEQTTTFSDTSLQLDSTEDITMLVNNEIGVTSKRETDISSDQDSTIPTDDNEVDENSDTHLPTSAAHQSRISPSLCPTSGIINWVCNARGQTLTDLTVGENGHISNGILVGTLNNQGWVSNLTIKPQGILQGGVVTGYIDNQGVMANFEFRGAALIGGTLSGHVVNTSQVGGYFKDIQLAAGTDLTGGTLQGHVMGDINSPALLKKLRLKANTQVLGVIFGEGVILDK